MPQAPLDASDTDLLSKKSQHLKDEFLIIFSSSSSIPFHIVFNDSIMSACLNYRLILMEKQEGFQLFLQTSRKTCNKNETKQAVEKLLSEAGNMAGKEPSHIPVKNRYAERFRMTFQNSGIK